MRKNKIKKTMKHKIIIIDDEQLILDMYQAKLEQEGMKVLTADGAEQGFELIKKEKPDLALIDLVMPKKDGFYLIEKIKNDNKLSCIPIIVLTNLDSPGMRKKACTLGVLFFLVKPHFMPSQIAEIINEVLSVKEKHASVLNCQECGAD